PGAVGTPERLARSAALRLLVRPQQREGDGKSRSLFQFAFHCDRATVFLDDASRDDEAESGAMRLGGKERLEETRQVLRLDAGPVVLNPDANVIRAGRVSRRGFPL